MAILFLTYELSSEPSGFTQEHEVRWADQDGIYRPMLVATGDDGKQRFFDIGILNTGEPPFPLLPTNLKLRGADFALTLDVDPDLFAGSMAPPPGDPRCVTINP